MIQNYLNMDYLWREPKGKIDPFKINKGIGILVTLYFTIFLGLKRRKKWNTHF